MRTQNYSYRDYEIQVTHTPPFWQAAIYAANPKLPTIDWALVPIRAANARAAEMLAQCRIEEVLGELKPATA
jgi:hypothetical protein